jgi:hypothetical protein
VSHKYSEIRTFIDGNSRILCAALCVYAWKQEYAIN